MPIIQMLFAGSGAYTQLNYNTTNNTKSRVTVIPESPFIVPVIPSSVRTITAEVWGSGGASGSAVYGTSGNGGGGGYVSAEISLVDLNISQLRVYVGGGGGNPLYADSPLGEYTEFIVSTPSYVAGFSTFAAASIDLANLVFQTPGDTLQPNDFVIVTSVADNGALSNPTGYTQIYDSIQQGNVSYQIYYKVMGNPVDTQVLNLTANVPQNQGGGGGGNGGDVAHAVLVFRNVDTVNPIDVSNVFSDPNNSNPNPPQITTTIQNCMGVAFGFLDNISITAADVSPPIGLAERIVQGSGGSGGGNGDATLMVGTRLLNAAGNFNPGQFTITNQNNQQPTTAVSLALRPQTTARFSSEIGGRGGSGGGYSAIFYSTVGGGGVFQPLIIVGAGGGGGGTSSTMNDLTAIAGSGGPGGGTTAINGSNGSLTVNPLSPIGLIFYYPAGAGGGAGSDTSPGFAGTTLISPGVYGNITNPGEIGVGWSTPPISTTFDGTVLTGTYYTGGRGANSPSIDITSIPLYGANSTGGWNRGPGGGASRTSTFGIPAQVPNSCGGGGGAGYYGGGGGGSGDDSPGGGGGGGSTYVDPRIIILENSVGIGTTPGNTTSPFLTLPGAPLRVGYGGTAVVGTGASVLGNPGSDGFVVLSFFA